MQPFQPASYVPPTEVQLKMWKDLSPAEMKVVRECLNDPVWLNDKYQVTVHVPSGQVLDMDGPLHLSVKRIDKEPIHDWRDLQEIKNLIAGPEREAFEIYPAESRLVDSANQYHLWVLAKGHRIPCGFNERLVAGSVEAERWGAKQRERRE